MEKEYNPDKYKNLKIFLILIFFLAALIGAVWFLGWRANQGEIIKEKSKTILNQYNEPLQ